MMNDTPYYGRAEISVVRSPSGNANPVFVLHVTNPDGMLRAIVHLSARDVWDAMSGGLAVHECWYWIPEGAAGEDVNPTRDA